MTKLQKYNQIIIAVFGTIAIIGGIIGILYILLEVFSSDNTNNSALLTEEKVQTLSKENLIQQYPVFEPPILLDSASSLYLFPISHLLLKDPVEAKNGRSLGFSKDFAPPYYDHMSSYSEHYRLNGNFNNFAISHDGITPEKLLFNFKINLSSAEFNKEIYPKIIFHGSQFDSNKDGVIDYQDFKNLYIYNLNNNSITPITKENSTVIEWQTSNDSDFLIIKYGSDINNDGEFDSSKEPSLLFKYSLSTGKLSNVFSDSLIEEIENGLNGQK
ncbi:MAG: hypothetical protein JNL74_08215 [Fibrobacteres bacterium]|nr:hypothetical protein [Fibrobacterota bacterium]